MTVSAASPSYRPSADSSTASKRKELEKRERIQEHAVDHRKGRPP